jgi:predicted metal-dependent hydrolase
MQQTYTYEGTLAASQRVHWRIEDIIGGDKRLDFTRPFMPESFARTAELTFLTPYEKRTLNQIRGHAYLSIFGLVEEFILPFVLDHAREHVRDDDYRIRALLQFAGEEAKHIHLFKRFGEEFKRGFGMECGVIGPPAEIARAVLAHDPLAVALAILQIEWMTQRHFTDSVKDDTGIDPQFANLLRYHWMEEAQHAKLDTLMVEALAEGRPESKIASAVEEYLEIGMLIDGGLLQQVELDMQALMRATRRTFSSKEKAEFRNVQRAANRWTYLGSGMTHEAFLGTLERLGAGARDRIEAVSPVFC